MESREWPDMGKEEPALEKVGLDDETPVREESPREWSSIEEQVKEFSAVWLLSVLGFLAAWVAWMVEK